MSDCCPEATPDRHKSNRADVMSKVCEIINKECADPAAELRSTAEVLLKIADALEGMNHAEAKAVMKSVAVLHDVNI